MSIVVENITKQFGSFRALDNVSLEFPTGELVALLGPSGCGKTTLLRIIAGLEAADSGRVLLEGEDTTDQHVRERQVGFVFQHYALFRHMNVFENIAFGLRVKKRRERKAESDIRAKVTELLQLVQLSHLADRLPSHLSGGQRQRVALARALAVEPRVLLLDEPFGALDAKVRKALRRWLRQLHEELHISSIFVTHDQEEALDVADRVVVMNNGKVEQVASPAEIYDKPASAFVFGFLGSSNVFRGTVDRDALKVGSQRLPLQSGRVAEGAEVVAYARPYEMEIIADAAPTGGMPARIARIHPMGAMVSIELVGELNGGSQPCRLEIDVPRDEVDRIGYAIGQPVRVVSRKLHVFPSKGEGRA